MKKLILFIITIHVSLFTLHLSAQWEWVYPYPQGNTLVAVTFTSGGTGYAVGSVGTIMCTLDGGLSWEPVYTGFKNHLRDICFIDDLTGWIVGDQGTILKTEDGGITWFKQNCQILFLPLLSVSFVDGDNGWAVGDRGIILHTQDGGSTWEKVDSGISSALYSVFFADINHGWISKESSILYTADGGATWQTQNVAGHYYNDVFFIDEFNGWTVGTSGTILHTTNSGESWQSQSSGTSFKLFSVFFSDQDNGWITGGANHGEHIILNTTDGGQSWTVQSSGESCNDLYSIYTNDNGTGCAVGYLGGIMITDDGGDSWQVLNNGGYFSIADIIFVDPLNGWAISDYYQDPDHILHTTDGGVTWSEQSIPADRACGSLYFIDQMNGWAYGPDLIFTTDGGMNWIPMDYGTDDPLISVYFNDGLSGRVITDHGGMLQTVDGGLTWEWLQSNSPYRIRSATFPNTEEVWMSGNYGMIMHSTYYERNWVQQSSGTFDDLTKVFFADGVNGWAIAGNGRILRTNNGGETWYEQYASEHSLYDLFFIDENNGYATGYRQESWWAYPSYGLILHTTDGGDNWVEEECNSSSWVYSVYFTDPDHGWAAGSNGILRSVNGKGSNQ